MVRSEHCGEPLGWYEPMEDYYCFLAPGHEGMHETLVPYRYPLMNNKVLPTKIAWSFDESPPPDGPRNTEGHW